ncbi:MAG: DctP family TRAP transporter solute-binding subunit [Firmicutes bacterium]|nr:DctP family TRAP transporter solute-binding subunit [Bacillota bacterium]
MRRLKSVLVMVLIITIIFNMGAVAATTIKLSHVVNEQDGFHIAALKFKELVEERTAGELIIEIHPNAELGDERTLLEGMQMGVIDMGVITNGPVSNFYPEIGVFEMPFLFANPEEAYYILDGPIGQRVLDNLSNVGLKGLAYAERGFRNLTNSKRAVETPEDMDKLKIRVMENQVYINTFKALGANAIPMAWTEALTALQQGTIDGQENPINVIYSFKLYETQDYLSITRHTYAPAIFVMSQLKFDSLSRENQQIFKEAAQEAAEYERNWNSQERDKQLAVITENGMQVSYPDLTPFQEAVESVYQDKESEFGDIIEKIREELANK